MGGIVSGIGALIGTASGGKGKQEKKVNTVIKEQKVDDKKAEEERRSRLRAALTDQPSLFETLSTRQGKTDL